MSSDARGGSSEPSLGAFDYELPPELIAQEPPERRGDSRLLVLDRATGRREHRMFRDLPLLLRPGDLLVVNETRVFPARLRARRATGGKVEVLLLEERDGGGRWSTLARPMRTLQSGEKLRVEPAGEAKGAVIVPIGREEERLIVEVREGAERLTVEQVHALCERAGETPLPPYVKRLDEKRRSREDRERYQTVYARSTGSVAAPTAGLHFTPDILDRVRSAGATLASVTLHVGLATFQPLTEESFARSTLHDERVEVSAEAGDEILRARREGRRVIAVGTTSVRAIEAFLAAGRVPFRARTDLFIKPGYTFRGVDALITNFHLPCSSLLVLVSAFAGREKVLEAYREAVRERYRFYSYGDAMWIA